MVKLSQNQQIQAALEDQQRQNSEYLKKHDANLYDLHKKEFELEKEKLVRTYNSNRLWILSNSLLNITSWNWKE